MSTGGFELIYKQVIPPAPAYLGLNLFLKGTQILHHKGSKKDKHNKNEQLRNTNVKPPPVVAQPHHMSNKEVMPTINASRTFIIDFTECDRSPERINRVQRKPRLPLFKKTLTDSNSNQTKPKLNSTALSRTSGSKIFAENSARGKQIDSARRHASCGPRLTTIQSSNGDDPPPATTPTITTTANPNHLDPNESNNNKKEFKCVGNKCCVDSLPQLGTDCNDNTITKNCTPRKGSSENINAVSKKQKLGLVKSKTSGSIPLTKHGKLLSCIDKDYQKFVGKNVNANKIQTRTVNDGYCSHFFAVGLSLRAWRSKYNKIAKLEKDSNLQPISTNLHISSDRKMKKNEVKVPKTSESTGCL